MKHTMKPQFEIHEGKLFRMLEEPIFLEPGDSEPFLIRLIADDSRMGKYNRGRYSKKELSTKYVLEQVSLGSYVTVSSGKLYSTECYQYEIIGYPVEEGSKEWALYQMMQGERVTKAHLKHTYWHYDSRPHLQCISEYICGTLQIMVSPEIWIKTADKDGWQKSPKQDDIEMPSTQYKVGDWVEIESSHTKGETFVSVIKEMPNQEHYTVHVNSFGGGYYGIMESQIIRKLKPSQVIVQIGCLSGTVKDLSYVEDGRFWLIGKATGRCPAGMYAILYEEMLDTETRELVEGLLKAQEEKQSD